MVMLVHWLTDNDHQLGSCNWSTCSMGRTVDKIEGKAESLKKNPSLMINDSFATAWFMMAKVSDGTTLLSDNGKHYRQGDTVEVQ